MNISLSKLILLMCLSIFFISGCQTSTHLQNNDTFGVFDNTTLKFSQLSVQEKSSLLNAQKQVYEIAQRILENHYLDTWFANYQAQNKLANSEDAKTSYYKTHAVVTDAEIAAFMKENAGNAEMLKIPESQRASIVKKYLTKVAQARAQHDILVEAYNQNIIKLVAFEKPLEQTVQFEVRGHVYDSTLNTPLVTLVEFADYQCPFCVKANSEIMKIVNEYKGKLQYIFIDFPLMDKHPQALPAALAAKCAENQGKYWEMHSLIFDRAPMAELNANKYLAFAQKLNLNLDQFKDCLNDPAQKDSILADLKEGLRVGVNETPTVYINGQKYDDYITYEGLKSAINKLF